MTEHNNHPKNKSNDSSINGCLLIILFALSPIILCFVVLSLVAISGFPKVERMARASAVKNGLLTVTRECLDRKNKNKTDLSWNSIETFLDEYEEFRGYEIQAIDKNSCFKAKALPLDGRDTWFEVDLNPKTGEVIKTCGDSTKEGCEEGNTW